MNYRHGFHAGNFADVLKHVVLLRILAHLCVKPAPFRVIDTHAGAGLYDLSGSEASRGGEWQGGIGRLASATFSPVTEALIAPYREAVAAFSPDGQTLPAMTYPGSPALIRRALRADDRAIFNELHPETHAALRAAIPPGARIGLTALDAYTAWKAQMPPPERRGLVLVDPPFELPGEYDWLADGLEMMARKWASGVAMLWFPIKNADAVARFEARARASGFAKLLWVELHVDAADTGPLAACGLAVANPPWTLHDELAALLPELAHALARGAHAGWRLEWLRGP